MSQFANRNRSELSTEELKQLEEWEHSTGPLSVLQQAVKNGSQILVNLRSNRKLLTRVKGFDRHMNMVCINAKEMWSETPRTVKGKKAKPVNKERFISKLFVRGDNVILIVKL